MSLEIRFATKDDINVLISIYTIARNYMITHGNPTQWGDVYPTIEQITIDIEKNGLYVCTSNNIISAVFACFPGPDQTYGEIEGNWTNNLEYHVIHRIASNNTVKDIGKYCIQWCLNKFKNIRIDTHKDNKKMLLLMNQMKFTYCGIVHVRNSERVAFQKLID
ncbi:hypothetical protein EIN_327080 [Entamoeba invadens IP1]|uniref:N-acetyltransferase domain-containing protein n=1 Tax=Entamoeba invadens IP1 TaxID=370355 RepID=A0A0A1U378_ENTIV|nr:hypothetical protein EIN_327080 [Entamoeba invadens IP1]ELP86061.1 hypothetical protein EIN_327080 [Entamoeba invadens IP1]|eukprot:XP_004185407.1 hypothetical protein EIN_327080 [Entamoeba invadens IP1]